MKRKNVGLDMPIRWNSNYKLLLNITKYKKVIQLYEIQLSSNDCNLDLDVLNDYDCYIVDLLQDLFENFDASTKIFVGCIIQLYIK